MSYEAGNLQVWASNPLPDPRRELNIAQFNENYVCYNVRGIYFVEIHPPPTLKNPYMFGPLRIPENLT